ncbi:hypothetical protein BDC45DRAFT_497398 [Circinella umbellata]|nr:hypothetical protein BDC45DRAFT_497398 [Circinella umbellata]
MSKHILLDPAVINMVIDALINPNARNHYSPRPTEWPNPTISDVLYLPNSPNDNFPPVLIEVQHMVDNDFILRLMTYAISVYRQYNKAPPIILTFVISSMKYEVSKKTTRSKKHPYLLQYSCQPWAKACYFVTESSIKSSLELPLPPFVALSTFIFGQHPSLSVNPYNTDTTIQLLYSIATRVFREQINEGQKPVDDLLLVCNKTENTIKQAIDTLLQEIPDVSKWSRTKKILDDGKLIPITLKRKYESIADSEESSSRDIPTGTNTNTNINTNTNTNSDTSTNTNTNNNSNVSRHWEYVQERLSQLNKDTPIPWERIYDDGRALGLFQNYSKWKTMKSNYYRWKKRQ